MKDLFGEKLVLKIFTTDSPEALRYRFRSATNVLFEDELISLEVALDSEKMKDFLAKKIE